MPTTNIVRCFLLSTADCVSAKRSIGVFTKDRVETLARRIELIRGHQLHYIMVANVVDSESTSLSRVPLPLQLNWSGHRFRVRCPDPASRRLCLLPDRRQSRDSWRSPQLDHRGEREVASWGTKTRFLIILNPRLPSLEPRSDLHRSSQ